MRDLIGKKPDSINNMLFGVFERTLKQHLSSFRYVFSKPSGTLSPKVSQLYNKLPKTHDLRTLILTVTGADLLERLKL